MQHCYELFSSFTVFCPTVLEVVQCLNIQLYKRASAKLKVEKNNILKASHQQAVYYLPTFIINSYKKVK